MKVFYDGNLNGKQVKVDEVNVNVDATRYPVRNIAMVHVEKAKSPNFLLARLAYLLAFCAVLVPIASLATNYDRVTNHMMQITMAYLAIWVFAYVVYALAYKLIGLTYHSVKFGNSASDKDVVALFPFSKEDLKPYILKSFDCESMSASSYQEITKFANAVSDSIDHFQNQSQSSN